MNNQKINFNKPYSRGFVFSLDALFSVFVLVVLLSSFSFLSARSLPQSLPQVDLQTKTNDLVVLLDKLGYISGMDSTNISNYINTTIASNLGWNATIEYYDHTGGVNGSFVLNQTLSLGENPNSDHLASATRIFVVQENFTVIHYGNILMTMWFK